MTGIGGVFFKSRDPRKLLAWYRQHLGIRAGKEGGASFGWRERNDPRQTGYTVWSPFPGDTRYFSPSRAPFMINFRVANLARLLAQLRKEGVRVVGDIEDYPYGRFAWVMDLEGHKIELWEPRRKRAPRRSRG